MAYSEADLAKLQRALATGVLRVRDRNGQETEFRSVSELRQAIADVEASLQSASGTGAPRIIRTYAGKGV